MALFINIPSGATGLSVSHSNAASGATSGTASTVSSGKVCVITEIRAMMQYTSTARVSHVRLLIDGKNVEELTLDSTSPDLTNSDGTRTTVRRRDLNIILRESQTLNIEIDNSNSVTKCGAEVSAYEYTP